MSGFNQISFHMYFSCPVFYCIFFSSNKDLDAMLKTRIIFRFSSMKIGFCMSLTMFYLFPPTACYSFGLEDWFQATFIGLGSGMVGFGFGLRQLGEFFGRKIIVLFCSIFHRSQRRSRGQSVQEILHCASIGCCWRGLHHARSPIFWS